MNLRLTGALALALPWVAVPQVAILHIQIVEGDGAVHAPGSRSQQPLVVEVTDETGRPVAGAAVTFTLPEDGPAGLFPNGLHTAVVVADGRGRAAVRSLQLNRTPGRFQVRITASREQARAGTVAFQYITGPKEGAPAESAASRSGKTKKWVWLALAAGAAAAGGIAAGASGGHAAAAVPVPPAALAAPPVPTVAIGPPVISVGKP
jgi:hypothetical protein